MGIDQELVLSQAHISLQQGLLSGVPYRLWQTSGALWVFFKVDLCEILCPNQIAPSDCS